MPRPTGSWPNLATFEVDDDGTSATWGDHVTDEEYASESVGPTEV